MAFFEASGCISPIVVHGDSSAKVHPWDAVKKDPAAPWWDFDYTFWGGIQHPTQ